MRIRLMKGCFLRKNNYIFLSYLNNESMSKGIFVFIFHLFCINVTILKIAVRTV